VFHDIDEVEVEFGSVSTEPAMTFVDRYEQAERVEGFAPSLAL
jgi:hypothetical protein